MARSLLRRHDYNVDAAVAEYHQPKPVSLSRYDPGLALLYKHYANKDRDRIGLEGTLALLEDLHIEPEDVRSLILAYMLQSPETGVFLARQFLDGCALRKVTSLQELLLAVTETYESLKTSSFEAFYEYTFDFIIGADSRVKMISPQDAVAYWRLLFDFRQGLAASKDVLQKWLAFIEARGKPVTRDTWLMAWRFFSLVAIHEPETLKTYDEMGVWPSVIDEFVEGLCETS